MKGFVPTPPRTVDQMTERLFWRCPPSERSRILDPGCGKGAFLEGIIRWCARHRRPVPQLVGIESDSVLAAEARRRLRGVERVSIREEDFLRIPPGRYDFVIGNPPYVGITRLSEEEKRCFRATYRTAHGRFDLYLLFFEQALRSLAPRGRLVFITPEKFIYVETAAPLRRLLAERQVEQIRFADEDVFAPLVTYPTISTVVNRPPTDPTEILLRGGKVVRAHLGGDGDSWLSCIHGREADAEGAVLRDACVRVSCGVATGADQVFVRPAGEVEAAIRRYGYWTLAGRELEVGRPLPTPTSLMLVPYDAQGRLLAEADLGPLGTYLRQEETARRLRQRTCVRRKPWYAFHDSVPLPDMLRPKILCKDIGARVMFWVDREGRIVPRHSIYYLVPRDAARLDEMCAYLNSPAARAWLEARCQRAANGFLRLQSRVLSRLPVPAEWTCAGTPTRSKDHAPRTEGTLRPAPLRSERPVASGGFRR